MPGPQSHDNHRIQLLKTIKSFQSTKSRGEPASDALPSLLTSMTSYLEHDGAGDDFDDVDDEDLILAEASETATVDLPKSKKDAKRPLDSEHGSPSQQENKKLKTDHASSVALARKILKETWGFTSFRHRQEEAIVRLIEGGSAVVVFPTGGGKSLVYQIPALAFDRYDGMSGRAPGGGLTLVVSPLIALMKVSRLSPFEF